ncbi:MAG: undecaprenyl-diphosphate phosphatase [Flavipsychrobacter sp.]|nr:undecaprenyl-diphosphate phosphatase [Flavipsychrobacter sp.]
MTWLQTIVLSIVEGITEFLPISSTGHMIIASSLMGIAKDDFTKLFEVCVQLGAILSVVVLYWRKFLDFSKWQFYVKLIVAFIPAAIMGLLFAKKIDALLESSMVVGTTLFIGGIVLLFIDRVFKNNTIDKVEQVGYPKAFIIGCFQVLAMIPGTSRSAATILGGLQQKLTRKLAAEFSFYLAVPTMFAATAKKLLDAYKEHKLAGTPMFQPGQLNMLLVGNVIAFIVALIAIRTFIQYVQKHTFVAFGIYRIIAGLAIFGLIFMGIIEG